MSCPGHLLCVALLTGETNWDIAEPPEFNLVVLIPYSCCSGPDACHLPVQKHFSEGFGLTCKSPLPSETGLAFVWIIHLYQIGSYQVSGKEVGQQ